MTEERPAPRVSIGRALPVLFAVDGVTEPTHTWGETRSWRRRAAGSVVRLVLGPREGDHVEAPSGGSGGGSSPDSDSPDAVSNA